MARAIINANQSKGTINKNIYGHFTTVFLWERTPKFPT